jgi:hypothetical protein
MISQSESIASVTFACICQLKQALVLHSDSVPPERNIINTALGLYDLLPYAYEHWVDHLLDFLASLPHTPLDGSHPVLVQLSELCQKLWALQAINLEATRQTEIHPLLKQILSMGEVAVITANLQWRKDSTIPGKS